MIFFLKNWPLPLQNKRRQEKMQCWCTRVRPSVPFSRCLWAIWLSWVWKRRWFEWNLRLGLWFLTGRYIDDTEWVMTETKMKYLAGNEVCMMCNTGVGRLNSWFRYRHFLNTCPYDVAHATKQLISKMWDGNTEV